MRLSRDKSSWRARSIIRRDFRHDPGLPETEVPAHRKTSRRSKHVHKYKSFLLGRETVRQWFYKLPFGTGMESRVVAADKWIWICKDCGHRTRHPRLR